MTAVTVTVPAKVNVQLAVGGRRPDGFHDLANVFLAVGLYDRVTASAADELGISGEGRDIGSVPLDATNLAARAAIALAKLHGIEPRVHLHIEKDIPVAGGMAGGARTRRGRCWRATRCGGWARRATSCCRSARNSAAMCRSPSWAGRRSGSGGGVADAAGGRGNLPLGVRGGGRGLSTPAVYRECDRLRREEGAGDTVAEVPAPVADPGLLDALRGGSAAALGAVLANDLQPAALSLRPDLRGTLAAGRAAGAVAALVSGSGPTCAFLAADAAAATRIASALGPTARTALSPAPGATILP